IVNNGNIIASGGNTSALIDMNGVSAQTISGSGLWAQITTNAGNNRFPGLQINNTSGANPAVSLNQNLALQSQLILTKGILGGTGALTEGIGAGTITM